MSADQRPATLSTVETTERYTVGNYARFPIAFTHGEGRMLWDEDGKRYLDLFSGLGVSCLGYGHAGLALAIAEQAGALLHTSNLFHTAPPAQLAQRIVERSFADRVFFCNSGTEATEAAIKMARRHGGERFEVVTVLQSFHGRTLGALAATGQPNLQEGFGPMPPGFVHVAHGDADALAAAVSTNTAAVLLEPVIGEGGVIVPPTGYLQAAREICDRAGALLVFDEVQCGWGRTGTLYAYEQLGATPDILCSAKGLAGGLPIGAVLATEEVASAFVPGTHGSTFGGNPVSCRAALAVLDAFDSEGVLENCRRAGDHMKQRLHELAAARGDIAGVRGLGLMLAIELAGRQARPVVTSALEHGLIINATAGNVVRFLPPLTITTAEIDEGIELLAGALDRAQDGGETK